MAATKIVISNEMKAVVAETLKAEYDAAFVEKPCSVHFQETIYSRYIKRALDILISFPIVVLTAPINLIIGTVTFFDVGRPIFFRQRRAGKNGKVFEIVKFRNMTEATDERGVLLLPSERVTKWGRIMRKTSLDELLNFWSILKGDMSLIGPRPLPDSYLSRYNERHKKRLCVRPGLECPPRDGKGFDGSWEKRFENDIWYVENISFGTDVYLFLRLIQFAVNRKASSDRGIANGSSFIGYNREGKAIGLDDLSQEYVDHALQRCQ